MIHTLIDPISGLENTVCKKSKLNFVWSRNINLVFLTCFFLFLSVVVYRFSEFVSQNNPKKERPNGMKIMHQFIWINSIDLVFSMLFLWISLIHFKQFTVFTDWIYDKMLIIIKIVNKIRHTHTHIGWIDMFAHDCIDADKFHMGISYWQDNNEWRRRRGGKKHEITSCA